MQPSIGRTVLYCFQDFGYEGSARIIKLTERPAIVTSTSSEGEGLYVLFEPDDEDEYVSGPHAGAPRPTTIPYRLASANTGAVIKPETWR